jgi:ATP-dependent Lon protease
MKAKDSKSREEVSNKEDTQDQNPKNEAKDELTLAIGTLPEQLYLVPIRNRPFFPAQLQPLVFNKDEWGETLDRVQKNKHKAVGLIFVNSTPREDLSVDDFPKIGCVVKIHNIVSDDNDQVQFIALGIQRFKIKKWLRKRSPFLVEVEYIVPGDENTDEIKAYSLALVQAIKELLPFNPLYSEELKNYLNRFSPRDPSSLADFAAAITTASGKELQEVMETISIKRRMEKVLVLIRKEQEVARLQNEINAEVNRKINVHQRDFFLKEQLKVIQKELGISKDDRTADIEIFKSRIEKLDVPKSILKKIDDEINKLSILETGSPEYAISRNYLDWATSVCWGKLSKDNLDIKNARNVLDKDHHGLTDVKDRIIEFLAVGSYSKKITGSILLLLGPPGVGKTSVGKSIAKSLGRKFYRFSVGGMGDEAEIKGHRRTYIGALPGKLVQALKDVEVMNPVIMLDEIDKIGDSYRGNPASALLEALDPEQNNEFLDHYLDMRIDLSNVLFICTANQLDSIPLPLFDRMDVIRLSGYIMEEKLAIAKKHIWPKNLKKTGVLKKQIKLSDSVIKHIIEGYAREAGVRNLEKVLQKIIRKSVVKFINKTKQPINITNKNLEEYLGAPIFRKDETLSGAGVVTGLAWTSMGGATLPVEASLIHSKKSGFKLTGKLGSVMKESAEIAFSFVNEYIVRKGINKEFFDNSFIHLHVPEGATPKDGPSAGITMATALISLIMRKSLGAGMAMTGELTLTGKVLAVGGIREKVIAARRQSIFNLIIPKANERDFNELPDYIRKNININFAETYQDVFDICFSAKDTANSKTATKKRASSKKTVAKTKKKVVASKATSSKSLGKTKTKTATKSKSKSEAKKTLSKKNTVKTSVKSTSKQ